MLKLICFISSDEYRTDGRNEYSKKLAGNIISAYAESEKKKEKTILLSYSYSEEEAEQKAEEHKQKIIATPKAYFSLPCI